METDRIWKTEPVFEDVKKMKCSEIEALSGKIREYIVGVVSSGDGHFAPNLGTIELTLALYKSFPPDDNFIVWDTGHQAYTHKVLTGRAEELKTIRKLGGISGYPAIHESEYDRFGVGHASTSIAASLGIETALKLLKQDGEVIAVIGDGAMTSGLAFEALNQIKTVSSKIRIILNDNGMSISPSVGQLSKKILNRLRTTKTYRHIDSKLYSTLENSFLGSAAEKVKSSLKRLLLNENFFEDFGLKYIGPIDGHNVGMMIRTFEGIKSIDGPVVVHVVTQKGKGIKYAEENPTKFHSVSMINPKDGISIEVRKNRHSYSEIFGKVLSMVADEDERIVGITAAMEDGTGLKHFHSKHPDRFFDLGITEELCTTFAAGAATRGLKPVVSIYSTFLQRAFDQIIHDVALQNLDVVFAVDRAGIVGSDGPTHHGVFDMAYMNMIPNMRILAPSSLKEFSSVLKSVVGRVMGPVAIRYPRESEIVDVMDVISTPPENDIFKWEKLTDGKDGTILAVGSMVRVGIETLKILKTQGVDLGLYNCRSVKPLDTDVLNSLISSPRIWTLEEGNVMGGFGASVLLNAPYLRSKIEVIGIKDEFTGHGSRNELLDLLGLTPGKIAGRIVTDLEIDAREG